MNEPWHLYAMSAMYAFAGVMHFVKPRAYMRIMPRFLPYHKELVYISGLAEILLAAGLCYPLTRDLSLIGIILMLAVYLLVHFNMLRGEKEGAGIPRWILFLRIPLQFGLMYWAYWYL